MDLIELAKIATALVVIAGTVYKYAAFKYGKEIKNVENSLITVGNEKTSALEALNEVKTLFECGKAAAADGKITPEEMEKIYAESMEIVNSPAVSKLLNNFGSK